jgi:hypothetical protein
VGAQWRNMLINAPSLPFYCSLFIVHCSLFIKTKQGQQQLLAAAPAEAMAASCSFITYSTLLAYHIFFFMLFNFWFACFALQPPAVLGSRGRLVVFINVYV